MARWRRDAPGGIVYHVLNRATNRTQIFFTDTDYQSFIWLLFDVARQMGMRVLAYCVMPNHWHLVLWPIKDGTLSPFVHRLTSRHARSVRKRTDTVGNGHVYQGPYRRFPVQAENYYYNVMRYVEGNALRAGLVTDAQDWPWSSAAERATGRRRVANGPLALPDDWVDLVNLTFVPDDLAVLQACAHDGRPYGAEDWVERVAIRCALEHTLRSRGRPRATDGSWRYAFDADLSGDVRGRLTV